MRIMFCPNIALKYWYNYYSSIDKTLFRNASGIRPDNLAFSYIMRTGIRPDAGFDLPDIWPDTGTDLKKKPDIRLKGRYKYRYNNS
jgi:hypothetical protein